MAVKKSSGLHGTKVKKAKVKRPGVHAKSKISLNKSSKHYVKPRVGQGSK
jgi:hypothetical protein